MSLFRLDNKVFGSFVVYGSLALAKTALMTTLTIYARKKNKNFASIEDAKFQVSGPPEKLKHLIQPIEGVERVS